jgi:two-component system chemotaxis response regulator CheY
MTLKSAGFQVVEAEDGIMAVGVFNSNSDISLIITDINMPNMGGIELTKKIRELNKTIPILMVTTESSDAMKMTGKSVGATGWIVKPFSPEKLISTIHRVL